MCLLKCLPLWPDGHKKKWITLLISFHSFTLYLGRYIRRQFQLSVWNRKYLETREVASQSMHIYFTSMDSSVCLPSNQIVKIEKSITKWSKINYSQWCNLMETEDTIKRKKYWKENCIKKPHGCFKLASKALFFHKLGGRKKKLWIYSHLKAFLGLTWMQKEIDCLLTPNCSKAHR